MFMSLEYEEKLHHIASTIALLNYNFNLHLRNNIIKLQSLTHIQLSSPRFHNLFKYDSRMDISKNGC